MTQDPLIRPHLTATREGRVDPAALVENWLDRADWCLSVPPDPEVAYDLLTLWMALRRSRSELIARADGGSLLERLDRLLDGPDGRAVVERARTVPFPDGWLEAALAFVTDDPTDVVVLAEQAVGLVRDLDEADLFAHALRRLGQPDEALETGLDRCTAWLWEHTWAFTAAGHFVQTLAASVRPDLEASDPGLLSTTDKMIALLDAAESFELELAGEDVTSLGMWLGQPVSPQTPTGPVTVVRFRDHLPAPEYAAAAAARTGPLRGPTLVWESPDRTYRARMYLPIRTGLLPRTAPLNLVHMDDEPATELAGQPCRLGALQVIISPDAQVTFALTDLTSVEGSLTVGEDRRPWLLVSDA